MIEITIPTKYFMGDDPSVTNEWRWCERTLGPYVSNNKDPNYWHCEMRWFELLFKFNNPAHATLFAMRFGSEA